MLKLFSTYLILFNTTLLFAQTVKSKDGVILGERSQFIKSCSHGAEKELMKIKGMEIQTYEYCSCVCDNLIPTINSWDLDKALKENKINELLLIDENLKVLMKCLEGNYKISENYKFTITDSYEEQKNIGISRCSTEVLVNDSSGIWTKQTAEEYCDCAIQKLFSKGYTYKEILDIEDENSTTFNEIAVPCVSEVFSKKSKTLAKSKKISEDIEGGTEKCIIPLTDYFGKIGRAHV